LEFYGITLTISNPAAPTAKVRVLDKYTGKSIQREIGPGESISKRWSLNRVFAGMTSSSRSMATLALSITLRATLKPGRTASLIRPWVASSKNWHTETPAETPAKGPAEARPKARAKAVTA
jgi:hypothetical protein